MFSLHEETLLLATSVLPMGAKMAALDLMTKRLFVDERHIYTSAGASSGIEPVYTNCRFVG